MYARRHFELTFHGSDKCSANRGNFLDYKLEGPHAMRLSIYTMALSAAFFSSISYAGVYKCRTDGGTKYSDIPCENAKQFNGVTWKDAEEENIEKRRKDNEQKIANVDRKKALQSQQREEYRIAQERRAREDNRCNGLSYSEQVKAYLKKNPATGPAVIHRMASEIAFVKMPEEAVRNLLCRFIKSEKTIETEFEKVSKLIMRDDFEIRYIYMRNGIVTAIER